MSRRAKVSRAIRAPIGSVWLWETPREHAQRQSVWGAPPPGPVIDTLFVRVIGFGKHGIIVLGTPAGDRWRTPLDGFLVNARPVREFYDRGNAARSRQFAKQEARRRRRGGGTSGLPQGGGPRRVRKAWRDGANPNQKKEV